MKIHLAALATVALLATQSLIAQNLDFGQTILGQSVPLSLKLKDLDSNWRVFKLTNSSPLGILSALTPNAGNCYTKGQTVNAGATMFLIVYKPEAPDLASMMKGGGMPKATPLTAGSILHMSLLNLQATTELEGLHPFVLADELGTSKKQANVLLDKVTELSSGGSDSASESDAQPVLIKKGTKAPEFTAVDAQGTKVSLAKYRGKVVVVDFWATWCGPCQESLPSTNKVAAKYKQKGVVFLAVNVWDQKKAFKEWLPGHKQLSSLRFLIDPSSQPNDIASKLYHVNGIPTQFVINRQGKVVSNIVGYGGDDQELVKSIKTALDQG